MSVNYTVAYDKKPTYIDDDMIELLRKAGEPTPEDLIKERKNYEYDFRKILTCQLGKTSLHMAIR